MENSEDFPSPANQSPPPVTLASPTQEMSMLQQEEQRIDVKVLHHMAKDANEKDKRFRRTVMAVHAIVSQKLYKTKSSSLEGYFRDAWKISRAQVYRFLDCAIVLHYLDDYSVQPTKERLCRSLKRLARNKADTRTLWNHVLNLTNNNIELVTSPMIQSAWDELLASGMVSGSSPRPEDDLMWDNMNDLNAIENENLSNSASPPQNSPDEDKKLLPSFNDSTQTSIDYETSRDIHNLSEIIKRLSAKGYFMQPFIGERWVESRVDHWRVVRYIEAANPSSLPQNPYRFTNPPPVPPQTERRYYSHEQQRTIPSTSYYSQPILPQEYSSYRNYNVPYQRQ